MSIQAKCTCGTCALCLNRAANRRHYASHADQVKRKQAAYRALQAASPAHEVTDAQMDALALAWLESNGMREQVCGEVREVK